jgi:replicative DNA helicase
MPSASEAAMNKPFTPPPRKQAPAEPTFRAPPHNIEAEQALLGAILINNEAFYRVSEFLEPKHFFEPIHQRVFELAGGLIRVGRLARPVTLKTLLPADLDIAGLTVNQYLARLAAEATTIINAEDYGRTVYDLSARRDLIAIGEDMVNLAYDAPVDATPLSQIENAERALYELAGTGKSPNATRSQAQTVEAALDKAARARENPGSLPGVSTGFDELDDRIGGLQAPDLVILAGRPGMGKTTLATSMACNVAHTKTPVLFFSLEMSSEQLGLRMLAGRAGVPSNDILRGKFSPEDLHRMREVATTLKDPLYIDESGGLSIAQLITRARRHHRQLGIGLVVVDYLQLLRGTTRRSAESRVQEITEITAGLKALAKELNVPVLALSQLSRALETREQKRPHLSDLRDSGTIEQDADVVLFVFREAYYHAMRKPDDNRAMAAWSERAEQLHNCAEVIVAKSRHGPTGTIELFFEPDLTRFSGVERHHG